MVESSSTHVIVIGVSAGGPKALQHFLPLLPAGFAHPLFVIQHYTDQIVDSLLQTLAKGCHLPLHLLTETQPLPAQGIYLCPPGHQCTFVTTESGVEVVIASDQTSTYRPSINVTMQSAATILQERVIGVLLTGMGKDGVEGLRAIKAAGGMTIAESEETAIVFGMPREAIKAGVVQRILPLHQIPTELVLSTQRGFAGYVSSLQLPQVQDPEELCQSIESWGEQGDLASMRSIIECLRDPSPIVVEMAGATLGQFPLEELFPDLLPLLQSQSPAIRTIAIELAKKHPLDPQSLSLLGPLCTHNNDNLRLFALEILAAYPPPSMEETILAMVHDENPNVALKALELLHAYHSKAALHALSAALEESPARRATAILALGRSHSDEALAQLLALPQRSFEDKFIWLHALKERSDIRLLSVLLDILPTLEEALLPHALEALENIAAVHLTTLTPPQQQALQALPYDDYFRHQQPGIRASALQLLRLLGTPQHLPTLMAYIPKAEEHEQSTILDILATMGDPKADACLQLLAGSDNLEVATHAMEWLKDR